MYHKYIVLLLISFFAYALAQDLSCTQICDRDYTRGDTVTFCSQTGVTHTVKVSAIAVRSVNSSCYARCGVAVQYVGKCGCPNECFSQEGHGVCSASNTCQCNAGWGGQDCSLVKCPSSCSGHGSCVSQSASKGGDYCKCANGFTAHDCSVPIPSFFNDHPYGSLNFGEVAGPAYYAKDKYYDAHPIFNYSVMATLKITMPESDFAYLLEPDLVYDLDYKDAQMFFYNGVYTKAGNCSFRTKGFSSRMNVKKSFNVKFSKDMDIKGFSVKTNALDRQTTSQVMWDVYRSQKVQTYRHGHVQLFVNDRFYGLASIEERLDDAWMESRWKVDDKKQANMYKIGPYALQYLGNNAEDYINYRTTLFDGKQFEVIEQSEGAGDWNDILDLILALNSSQAIATEHLQNHFRLGNLAKGWALETAFRNTDASLGTGNNYIFVDTKEGPNVEFDFTAYDFDTALTASEARYAAFVGIPLQQLLDLLDAGATVINGIPATVFVMNKNPYMAIDRKDKPLSVAALRVPGFNTSFTQAYKDFVRTVIVGKPGLTEEIRKAHQELARPILAQDRMWRISGTATGNTIAAFDAAGEASKAWIEERWGYLASMFHVNNRGTCNGRGECVCHDNYFGETCDSFCGLDFVQTKTGGWNDGTKNYTQYQVNLYVGAAPLRQLTIDVNANGASFDAWNLNKIDGTSNSYSIPSWQYKDGVIAANSNSVSFGYTISSNTPAKFRMQKNACATPSCTLQVSVVERSSWVSGNTAYKQVDFQVYNSNSSPAANVKIELAFQGGAYVSQSWNVAPATSSPSSVKETFTLSLFDLAPGQTSTSAGAIIAYPVSSSSSSPVSLSVVGGTCV